MEQERMYVRAEMDITRFTADMITTDCSLGDAACYAEEACKQVQCSATEKAQFTQNLEQFFAAEGPCDLSQEQCYDKYINWQQAGYNGP